MIKKPIPCPFCAEIPMLMNDGTTASLDCCVSMFIQKCDYLTTEERETWDDKKYIYSKEVEIKLINILVDKWNTRKFKG